MEIKYQLYPYPVLSHFSNDYKDCIFKVEPDVKSKAYEIELSFLATLTCKDLSEYIREGKALFVYHIECSQTSYRYAFMTSKEIDSFSIYSKNINGKLQICPFIVAATDLTDFTSSDFHEDYSGISFDIEEGCVLAVGKTITVDITKNTDEIADTPSIFNIVKNSDESCNQMLVDMFQRKIMIKLPRDDFEKYKILRANPLSQSILNSLTVIPALTFVLGELKSMSPQERAENCDTLWYQVLKKVIKAQFECDVESEEFNSKNSLVWAQELIANPISDSFTLLTSSFDTDGDDD